MNLIKKQTPWFPSFADEFFKNDWPTNSQNVPAVNVKEHEKGYTLDLAIPGKQKEGFQIELNKDVLSISYEEKDAKNAAEEKFTRREFNYHSFKRSFSIPETIDTSKIHAEYTNGLLQVSLPKRKEVVEATKKQIVVK